MCKWCYSVFWCYRFIMCYTTQIQDKLIGVFVHLVCRLWVCSCLFHQRKKITNEVYKVREPFYAFPSYRNALTWLITCCNYYTGLCSHLAFIMIYTGNGCEEETCSMFKSERFLSGIFLKKKNATHWWQENLFPEHLQLFSLLIKGINCEQMWRP